jgi:diguanylate cyclase (GGDEF)-like protein
VIEEAVLPEGADSQPPGQGIDKEIAREEAEQADAVAGLYDRQQFIDILRERATQSEPGQPCQGVCYLLLDNFAQIRKDIGVLKSDLVLREISGLLKSNCPEADVFARFGDYSFAVLHASDTMEGITAAAEQLRVLVEQHVIQVDGRSVSTTASIGVCVISEYTHNEDEILTRADLACEVARTSGGNRVHTHSNIIDEQIDHANEENWDNVIRKTLDDKRFYLAYQPIVSLGDEPTQYYEVLLRILDEENNVILPGQFISVAERIGLAVDIDRYVIENALRGIAESDNRGIQLFIKLSNTSLGDHDLPMWIHGKLEEYGVDKDRLVFEVSENAVSRDPGNVAALTKALHDAGCLVAIEHLSGAIEAQHLEQVHANILKIDGRLIGGLAKDREIRAKVNSIVALARRHGMVTVAERVEDAAGLAVLWELGIQYAQGNFIREPSRKLNYDFLGEIVSEDVDDGRSIFMPETRVT